MLERKTKPRMGIERALEVKTVLSKETFERRPEGGKGASSGDRMFQAEGTASVTSTTPRAGCWRKKRGGRCSRSGVSQELSGRS